jgi:hypothetical protein
MKNLTNWARLAAAACDARDELRAVLPRLDRSILDGTVSTEQLAEFRRLAAHHAEQLRRALKAPAKPRSRRNALSSRAEPLWRVAETADDERVEVRT